MGNSKSSSVLTPQPLYKRAELEMTNRIATGTWSAGAQLPNEFALAEEFGVSQGTIRKALVSLERRGLLTRSPGRGTRVAITTQEEALYAFFRLRDDHGDLVVPHTLQEKIEHRQATDEEKSALGPTCTEVAHLMRVRHNEQRAFVHESMSFDASVVTGMAADLPLPSSLYPYLHERFGITIMNVQESISAVLADDETARALGIAVGSPLLKVGRLAYDLAERVVELRSSYYRTDFATYQVKLPRSEKVEGIPH